MSQADPPATPAHQTRLPIFAFALGLLFVLLTNGIRFSAQTQTTSRTIWDGVYTIEQANRGGKAYTEACAACHMDNLMGDDLTPPMAGEAFLANWDNLALGDLFTKIKTTMPKTPARGSLTDDSTRDLIAFLLATSKMPAGAEELKGDGSVLRQVTILKAKP